MQGKTEEQEFRKSLVRIALPVALQSLLQSSFGMIDQVMIGQLGSMSIAGIGIAGKFAGIYSVVLGAVSAAAGIMLAQYSGQGNEQAFGSSFRKSLILSLAMAAGFLLLCVGFAPWLMSLYTKDTRMCETAVAYLRIYAWSFVLMAVTSMASVRLRCVERAFFPLLAGIFGVALNTGLNYVLIFGRCGFSPMGVRGAAIASVIAQSGACVLTLLFLFYVNLCNGVMPLRRMGRAADTWVDSLEKGSACEKSDGQGAAQFVKILTPVLVCEFLWSAGENVYAAIYARIGTDACAAMTMTGPVQGIFIGALSGLAQAAGIMIGKSLGNRDYDKAYADGKRLMRYGLSGALLLSALLLLLAPSYAGIYNVSGMVRAICVKILTVFAALAPVKVCNMILGGGILRSGGKTDYVMWVDIIGTWMFGVPLGLFAAFVLRLSIPYVYLLLSLEEVVRLLLSLVLFQKRGWMKSFD